MPNLAKCYQTQSCQKWSYVYRILTNASREYISKCSCHLRAFRAIADVANYGKSVIVPKVAIFGKLWKAGFANFGKLWIARIGKKNLAMHKDCQKWQNLLGKFAIFGKLLVTP